MMAQTDYHILHAFAAHPKAGNPAAVVILDGANVSIPTDSSSLRALYPPDHDLQQIASHLDKPMTAFVVPLSKGDTSSTQSYGLRWFNPVSEAWLCGHATMAASSLLFSRNQDLETIEFTTMRHGILRATRTDPGLGQEVEGIEVAMDFPELTEIEPVVKGSGRWVGIVAALEEASAGYFSARVVLEMWDSEERVLVEVEAGFDLAGMKIDCDLLVPLTPVTIILTQVVPKVQHSGDVRYTGERIRSRVFVIVPGFPHEDMVTGSAHCLVVPYLHNNPAARQRLLSTTPSLETDLSGHDVVRVRQVSAGDGRFTAAWIKGDGKVRITGKCVAVQTGTLHSPV